jgi:uroporphyrinogen decarboxylase
MTARERYRKSLLFGKPDRVFLAPGGPRESTLAAWRRQGLGEDENWAQALGLSGGGEGVGINFRFMPEFEEKILEVRDGHKIIQDFMGAIVEIDDQFDFSYIRSARDFVTRKWHKFPVASRRDFEEMKKRFDPATPGRLPDDFGERVARWRERDYPLTFGFNGCFWQLREWCGFEGLCTLMADDPAFVEAMCEFWTEFVSQTMAPALRAIEVDSVCISEDMAYKEHAMISPAMARKFLLPAYKRWSAELRASGCPIVSVDSDGYIGELIPVWIEGGINCTTPLEVAAGNDIVAYRREFGRDIAFQGGIDKRALAKGGEVMRAELLRVIPPLLEHGGYIPGCDHGVPPDISWPNFQEYVAFLKQLTGWK